METPIGPKRPRNPDGALASVVRVESLLQLGFLLPCAVLLGWLAGVGLDHVFHQHWMYIAGIFVGAIAGFVQIFRVVARQLK